MGYFFKRFGYALYLISCFGLMGMDFWDYGVWLIVGPVVVLVEAMRDRV